MLSDLRRVVRGGMRWLDRQPGLVAVVQAGRRVIPGDSGFGDPMSTSGTSPAQALGRRVWMLSGGRWSLLAELALAGLQLADWLGEDVRGIAAREEMSILFVDLSGFSQWALRAGDEAAAELLRGADAITTEVFETNGGVVVKRLGDGAMAIFAECDSALDAAFEAISRVREARVDGYAPALRAGLHVGRPQRIGNDFVGVDVNIAARLCEAAPAGDVMISNTVRERVGDRWNSAALTDVRLRGVPADVAIYVAQRDGRASPS